MCKCVGPLRSGFPSSHPKSPPQRYLGSGIGCTVQLLAWWAYQLVFPSGLDRCICVDPQGLVTCPPDTAAALACLVSPRCPASCVRLLRIDLPAPCPGCSQPSAVVGLHELASASHVPATRRTLFSSKRSLFLLGCMNYSVSCGHLSVRRTLVRGHLSAQGNELAGLGNPGPLVAGIVTAQLQGLTQVVQCNGM